MIHVQRRMDVFTYTEHTVHKLNMQADYINPQGAPQGKCLNGFSLVEFRAKTWNF